MWSLIMLLVILYYHSEAVSESPSDYLELDCAMKKVNLVNAIICFIVIRYVLAKSDQIKQCFLYHLSVANGNYWF